MGVTADIGPKQLVENSREFRRVLHLSQDGIGEGGEIRSRGSRAISYRRGLSDPSSNKI